MARREVDHCSDSDTETVADPNPLVSSSIASRPAQSHPSSRSCLRALDPSARIMSEGTQTMELAIAGKADDYFKIDNNAGRIAKASIENGITNIHIRCAESCSQPTDKAAGFLYLLNRCEPLFSTIEHVRDGGSGERAEIASLKISKAQRPHSIRLCKAALHKIVSDRSRWVMRCRSNNRIIKTFKCSYSRLLSVIST
ncbi:hypothetical protein LX32DRAFT_687384, partial [Colletotrichum zoysiae]